MEDKGTMVEAQIGPPPYGAYAAIMGAFAGGLAVAGGLARLLEAAPPARRPRPRLLSAASFKASRTLARDEVASFVRAPFVEGTHTSRTRSRSKAGSRQAIGELLTCTRCVGTWAAAGLATTQVLRRASDGC